MWWNKTDEKLSYVSYQVNQTEIMVGPRLSARGCSLDFFNSVSAWLVVTESYIEYPISANVRWFPWKEHQEPLPDHVVYGSLKMLNYWVNELKLPRVYIHCDLGSHRAPTVFGAFLYAYFKSSQVGIIKSRKVIRPEQSTVISLTGEIHGNPEQYFNSYLEHLPLLETMIKMIIENPQAPLDVITELTFANRPLRLYTSEEKKVFEAEQQVIKRSKKIKEWLKQDGFVFNSESDHGSVFNAQTPRGLSDVIGDRFFPEMLNSLKKYNRLYLTSEAGLAVLKEKIPQVKIVETKTKEDLVLYYVEMDLNTYEKK